MSSFSAYSIPTENILTSPQENEFSYGSVSYFHNSGKDVHLASNNIVYNIRDKEHICALSLINDSEAFHPGSNLSISVNFENFIQPCKAIRAYLMQIESRKDGSKVQVRIIPPCCNKNLLKYMNVYEISFIIIYTTTHFLCKS